MLLVHSHSVTRTKRKMDRVWRMEQAVAIVQRCCWSLRRLKMMGCWDTYTWMVPGLALVPDASYSSHYYADCIVVVDSFVVAVVVIDVPNLPVFLRYFVDVCRCQRKDHHVAFWIFCLLVTR